jgi:GDP-mannose pyrophosphatase NudK
MNTRSLAILIAGPYRSGTNDDPALIEANMRQMNEAALEVYRKGHLPLLGEWLALPLIKLAGSKKIGDEVFNEIFHPSSIRLLEHCDAVLRIGGPSKGADEMVAFARENQKQVFASMDEVPAVS